MLTEKDYCDYDTSIALGELGFPLKRMKVKNLIDRQFSDSIVTALLYEAQKWLREKKNIETNAHWSVYEQKWHYCIQTIVTSIDDLDVYPSPPIYNSYEEALSEGIKEAIKILKEDETIHR